MGPNHTSPTYMFGSNNDNNKIKKIYIYMYKLTINFLVYYFVIFSSIVTYWNFDLKCIFFELHGLGIDKFCQGGWDMGRKCFLLLLYFPLLEQLFDKFSFATRSGFTWSSLNFLFILVQELESNNKISLPSKTGSWIE